MTRSRVTAWLSWWVALAGLYLVLADSVVLPELVTGAALAALGATGALLVRRDRRLLLHPRARWLGAVWRPLLGLGGDLVPLARALLRGHGSGGYVEIPFDARYASDEPEAHAYRALTEILGSLAPNTVVVEVDPVRHVVVAHQLEHRN